MALKKTGVVEATPKHRDLVSVNEAAERCSIGRTTAYKWLNIGIFRSQKILGRRLIDEASVREIAAACRSRDEGQG